MSGPILGSVSRDRDFSLFRDARWSSVGGAVARLEYVFGAVALAHGRAVHAGRVAVEFLEPSRPAGAPRLHRVPGPDAA